MPGRKITASELWRLFKWYLIYLGPRRDLTLLTSNGRMSIDSKRWLIGKYLYVGGHEEHEIRDAVALLVSEGYFDGESSGRTVLNVGANIGLTCIGLLNGGQFTNAIAIEPEPENFRLLRKNIEQNGLNGRVHPYQIALSSTDAELELELSGNNAGDHRIRKTEDPGFYKEEKRRTINVEGKTLDTFWSDDLASSALENIDLLWVDIQGHEGHFFEGASRFLAKKIPVVCEFWPYGIERSGMPPDRFCDILSRFFSHFYIVGSDHRKKTPIAEVRELFDVYCGPRAFELLSLVSD